MPALRKYEEHHFQGFEDIGVAFNHDRIWVCVDGRSLLRAKWFDRKLQVEYEPLKSLDDTDGMSRQRAIDIVMELADQNRISHRDQEEDLVLIRKEQDEAFAVLANRPLR